MDDSIESTSAPIGRMRKREPNQRSCYRIQLDAMRAARLHWITCVHLSCNWRPNRVEFYLNSISDRTATNQRSRLSELRVCNIFTFIKFSLAAPSVGIFSFDMVRRRIACDARIFVLSGRFLNHSQRLHLMSHTSCGNKSHLPVFPSTIANVSIILWKLLLSPTLFLWDIFSWRCSLLRHIYI